MSRNFGIQSPLYVPPPAPKLPTNLPRLDAPGAAFWTIGVPLLIAAAISMIGLGFVAADRIGDIIGAMQ